MDALLASAGPLSRKDRFKNLQASSSSSSNPPKPRRNGERDRHAGAHKSIDRGPNKESIDPTHNSILSTTRVPSSFHRSTLPTGSGGDEIKPEPSILKIRDKKLRAKVIREDVAAKRAKEAREDVNEWLNEAVSGGQGDIEVDEEEGERTWRVGQEEIVREVGVASGRKKFDLEFEGMGEYMVDYTRNGR
jgi:U3 small nucleolar RNA-associated protein 7